MFFFFLTEHSKLKKRGKKRSRSAGQGTLNKLFYLEIDNNTCVIVCLIVLRSYFINKFR